MRARSVFFIVLVALAAFAAAMSRPPQARAATFVVSHTGDSGPGSLREAITNANAAAGADTITFGVGGTILLASTLPNVADALTVDGTGQTVTVDGNNTARVFIVNSGVTFNLQNLTVTRGKGEAINSTGGGAIRNDAGVVNVTNVTFSSNNSGAGGDGGAIRNDISGTLVVTGSTFTGNQAGSTRYGGALANFGTATIVSSTFSSNTTNYGGAIYNRFNTGVLTVRGTAFSNNDAYSYGGAIYNDGSGGHDAKHFFEQPRARILWRWDRQPGRRSYRGKQYFLRQHGIQQWRRHQQL